jgi:hypothetical protein
MTKKKPKKRYKKKLTDEQKRRIISESYQVGSDLANFAWDVFDLWRR